MIQRISHPEPPNYADLGTRAAAGGVREKLEGRRQGMIPELLHEFTSCAIDKQYAPQQHGHVNESVFLTYLEIKEHIFTDRDEVADSEQQQTLPLDEERDRL